MSEYSEIFQEGLGKFTGHAVKVIIDLNTTHRFYKAKTVPYSIRAKVEEELRRLVEEGTLKQVEYSDWAAPIVAVVKSNIKMFGYVIFG